MKSFLAEATGTFALVIVTCGASLMYLALHTGVPGPLTVSLAVGLCMSAMLAALGSVSGGHFNPAVTCGLIFAGRFPARRAVAYVVAQVLGGGVAALLAFLILAGQIDWTPGRFASNGYGASSPGGYPLIACFLAEFFLTALFVLVFCRVTRESGSLSKAAPIAVGLMLTSALVVVLPITGGSLNPARSTATALFAESWALQQLWMFWAAPLAGGALAGIADRLFGDVS